MYENAVSVRGHGARESFFVFWKTELPTLQCITQFDMKDNNIFHSE